MGICAYIDILGFSNFVNESSEGAIKVLQNYQVQLQFLDKFPKGNTYTAPYKTDSFNYLIPFSDSIFFYSESPSEFVMQLSNFVNGSFSFTSDAFSNPEDPLHPENVTEKGAVIENGKVVMKDFPAKWYPLLFRGGIGFGDARVMELHCIHNGEKKKTPFVFGNSVIEAVKMETVKVNDEKLKGPRILCTELFYNQLDDRAKKIVHPAFDIPEYYEVNWTAVHYLMTDDPNEWNVNMLLVNDYHLHLLTPASNLWKAYRNSDTSLHYKNFLKLIVRGVQHYFDGTKFSNQTNIYIKESIEKEKLTDISEYLLAEIIYKIDIPKNYSEEEKNIFCDLLKQQGKVTNPTIDKLNRCTFLCICKVDNSIVSIGAIKSKTDSDFNPEKSDLDNLRNEFQLELGYCFTLPKHCGNGYSSNIVKLLLNKTADQNLMASTELRFDNSMKRILERNKFKQFGKSWKSGIHGGTLGLFLKYAN